MAAFSRPWVTLYLGLAYIFRNCQRRKDNDGGEIPQSALPTIFKPCEDSDERSLRICNKDDQNNRGKAARRRRSQTLEC